MPRGLFPAVATTAIVTLISVSSAFAQTLTVGSAAPKLVVSEFVKGAPVGSFQSGQTYVVEFWATWCGPCKVSIPHLTQLQKQYPKIKFIGVSVWEENQKLVKPFVKTMGANMGYTVCMDKVPAGGDGNSGTMAKTWMQAAGQNGIPTAFIINGQGKVAWIGHPMEMAEPLKQISAGKWSIAAAKAAQAKKDEAQRKQMALQRKAAKWGKELQPAMQAKDMKQVVAIVDKAVAEDAELEQLFAPLKFAALRQSGDEAAAASYGETLVNGTFKDDPQSLNGLAWNLVDPAAKKKAGPELLKFALLAAKRADSLTGGKEAAIADTLAVAYAANGDMKSAYEAEKRAAAGMSGDAEIKGRLAEYKKAAGM